jgi:hypothetical protein
MGVKIGNKIGIDSAYKGLDPIFRDRLTDGDMRHFINGYNQAIQDMQKEIENMELDSNNDDTGYRDDCGVIVKKIRIRLF